MFSSEINISDDLCLTDHSAVKIHSVYPGINRMKPSTYFGSDYRYRASLLGLKSTEEIRDLFNRVLKAYEH